MLYFTDLSLDEKLKLLNQSNELNDLIDLLQNYNYEWDFITWKFSSTYLLNAGLNELALRLNEIMLENHFEKIKSEDKYFLYDGLGTIHRNLGNYDEAFKNYREAYKWIDVVSLEGQPINKNYQRGICLKNIGENYGHKGDYEEMNKKFIEVEAIIKSLESVSDRYRLYMNLSVAMRRLNKFEKEREYINKALEFVDNSTPLQDIEQRIGDFEETEMSFDKLMEGEILEKIHNYNKVAKFLSEINNHKLSIGFYEKALESSEEVLERNQRLRFQINIFRGMAISYFYLRDWKNSKISLEKYLALEKNFQSELYYFIVLYLSGEVEEATNKLIIIIEEFKKSSEHLLLINDWLIQIINSFGRNKFLELTGLFETLNDDLKEFLFFQFGNALANNGFSELALQFFERELEFIKDDTVKATILNDIGGVYSDLDEYDIAIDYFKKALELDKEYDLCYRNLAEIYSRKLDNSNAKQSLEKAIRIAKKELKPNLKIYEKELQEINQMVNLVLNIEGISSVKIKNILITAERKLIDYRKYDNTFDASDIILDYSKALEIMLDEKVAIHFIPLVKKYKKNNKQPSEDFRKKFGWLFQDKTISLGTWVRIIKDFEKKSLEPDVHEFRVRLKSKFTNEQMTQLKNTCDLIVDERNAIAHTKVLTIDQVREIRNKVVPQFNLIVKFLFK